MVGHDHRTELRDWFGRKSFYGSSAAPLALRHPGKTAPLVLSGWTLLVWILLAMGSGFGYFASTVVAIFTGRKIADTLSSVETDPKDVAAVAARGPLGRRVAVGVRDLSALLAPGADRRGLLPPVSSGGTRGRRRRRGGRLGHPERHRRR